MVVTSAIGMLASLAVPYWAKASETAPLNLCLQKQRTLFDAVVLYELEQGKYLKGIASNGKKKSASAW